MSRRKEMVQKKHVCLYECVRHLAEGEIETCYSKKNGRSQGFIPIRQIKKNSKQNTEQAGKHDVLRKCLT
jgi:hypothetical protein